jgi:hypothetical protein
MGKIGLESKKKDLKLKDGTPFYKVTQKNEPISDLNQ